MPNNQQADGEIHEDQLLNFLVNTLTGAFSLSLGENAETAPEDIWEVLVGACADGTSISTLCGRSEDSPSANDVLYHLRTKFDLDTIVQVGNSLLQKDVLDPLPEQVEIVVDLHLRPYYGDEDETDGLYHSEATDGTTGSTPTPRCTPACATNATRWRCAVSPTATPPVLSSQSSLELPKRKFIT